MSYLGVHSKLMCCACFRNAKTAAHASTTPQSVASHGPSASVNTIIFTPFTVVNTSSPAMQDTVWGTGRTNKMNLPSDADITFTGVQHNSDGDPNTLVSVIMSPPTAAKLIECGDPGTTFSVTGPMKESASSALGITWNMKVPKEQDNSVNVEKVDCPSPVEIISPGVDSSQHVIDMVVSTMSLADLCKAVMFFLEAHVSRFG